MTTTVGYVLTLQFLIGDILLRLLFLVAVACYGLYFFIHNPIGPASEATDYVLADQANPVRIGHLSEITRKDLFVPYVRGATYEVPDDLYSEVKRHKTDGRRWYSYEPRFGSGPYPVVILFHGAGRSGLSMIDMWREVADRKKLLLIAPEPQTRWMSGRERPETLHEILSVVKEEGLVNSDRIYIFGHSEGARYVEALINRVAGPWKAAAVHAGFSNPSKVISPADPKPIRYYLGTRDHIFLPNAAREAANGMAANGHDVELHMIPGHTHWFYDVGPKIAADAWNWLALQR